MKVLLILIFSVLTQVVTGQDRDRDGINDELEQNLAALFAPQWNFNIKQNTDIENSNQNRTELYFPSSVEWLFEETIDEIGDTLYLEFKNGCKKNKVTIKNMDDLWQMIDPKSKRRSDDSYWKDKKRVRLSIKGYPDHLKGDPDNFPTYYHCRIDSNLIRIEYYLFFPFDYKNKNPATFGLFQSELGKHRGDWEYVVLFISNIHDFNSNKIPSNVRLHAVVYGGHGPPPKRVFATSKDINIVEKTHPNVFIAYGSHAMYPEPGEWRNYKIKFIPDHYDDMFHKGGLSVKSWNGNRKLINLGETNAPYVGWLNYKGRWGPDRFFSTSSPPSPPFKGGWNLKLNNLTDWEIIKSNYSKYYKSPMKVKK